jgi:hypothetical protein
VTVEERRQALVEALDAVWRSRDAVAATLDTVTAQRKRAIQACYRAGASVDRLAEVTGSGRRRRPVSGAD